MSRIEDPVAWVASQRADPVRRRVLHALAQRAHAQPPGALRDKLIAILLQRASIETPEPPPQHRCAPANPLAELRASLQSDNGHELRQLQIHEETWRRLRIARSTADLKAPVAANLGPLNGQALATRALQQIQLLAPRYLHSLLTQMDALAALEHVLAPIEAENPTRTSKKKSPARQR